MSFKTFFESKKPKHFNFNISVIEGPVNLHNGHKHSYRIKVNGKDAVVGPIYKDIIDKPGDIGWEYGNGHLYTPGTYEEMNAAIVATFKAIKAWDVKKTLNKDTIKELGDLIDEL
jgi:hypothetical protein